jgi:hypothetical protein
MMMMMNDDDDELVSIVIELGLQRAFGGRIVQSTPLQRPEQLPFRIEKESCRFLRWANTIRWWGQKSVDRSSEV